MMVCVIAQRGVLELQRHAVGVAQHRHRLAVFQIHAVHGGVQRGDFVLLQPRRAIAACRASIPREFFPRHRLLIRRTC